MCAEVAGSPPEPIVPPRVRYIKLGRGGGWERESIDRGIIRFGYGSERESRFRLATDGRWSELAALFEADGAPKGNATRFANEIRAYFEDDGTTLWITFMGEQLYWGFLTGDQPEPESAHSAPSRVSARAESADSAARRKSIARKPPPDRHRPIPSSGGLRSRSSHVTGATGMPIASARSLTSGVVPGVVANVGQNDPNR